MIRPSSPFNMPHLNCMPWHPKLHNEKGDNKKRIRLFPDINGFSGTAIGVEFNCCYEQEQCECAYNQKLDAPIFGRITITLEFFEDDG